MTVDEVPAQLRELLDQRAGKVHSQTGSVMSALAEILTAYRTMILSEINSSRSGAPGE